MLKKVLSIVVMSGLFSSGAFAEDLLAQITNGALSDTSKGVRLLSAEEEKQIVGGYVVNFFNSGNELYAVALYGQREDGSGEIDRVKEYINSNGTRGGLCGIDTIDCAGPSQGRMRDYLYITNGSYEFFPVYIVKRNIGVSNLGQKYIYFTYGTGMLDRNMQLYKFDSATSSIHLNNSMIIKEMRDKYKTSMESTLGGWSVR